MCKDSSAHCSVQLIDGSHLSIPRWLQHVLYHPPELATAPLLDPVAHVNDDDIVLKCIETELVEESCAIPPPVQVLELERELVSHTILP